MRDLLERINTQTPGLIKKFGGHAMAAGLTIAERDFERFKAAFSEQVGKELSEEHKQSVLLTDGELPGECFSLAFAGLLQQAGPWGQHFPEPVFEHEFILLQQRLVGEKHLKMVLRHQSGRDVDAIAFNVDLRAWPNAACQRIKLAYQLDINEFRGKFSLQLIAREIKAVD